MFHGILQIKHFLPDMQSKDVLSPVVMSLDQDRLR